MNSTLWIVHGVLAAVFLASGTVMLTQPRAWLIEKFGAWVEAVPSGLVRLLGAVEVLAAIGLIVPPATGILPVLAPLAACGMVIVMIGAIIIHVWQREYLEIVLNVALGAMAVFAAWGRVGPHWF
jgi:hypothetical protein